MFNHGIYLFFQRRFEQNRRERYPSNTQPRFLLLFVLPFFSFEVSCSKLVQSSGLPHVRYLPQVDFINRNDNIEQNILLFSDTLQIRVNGKL